MEGKKECRKEREREGKRGMKGGRSKRNTLSSSER